MVVSAVSVNCVVLQDILVIYCVGKVPSEIYPAPAATEIVSPDTIDISPPEIRPTVAEFTIAEPVSVADGAPVGL